MKGAVKVPFFVLVNFIIIILKIVKLLNC